jgi:hypothetical protein
MRVMGLQTRDIIPSTDPQIIALTDRVDTLTEITALVREYMETLLEAQGHASMQQRFRSSLPISHPSLLIPWFMGVSKDASVPGVT